MQIPPSLRTGWRLIPVAATGSLALALIVVITALLLLRQQLAIEHAAGRINDVAMPQVVEATRMVRGLERLAREGETILWVTDAAKRTELRQRLQSVAEDGVLQGEFELRETVTTAMKQLDWNLNDLAEHGPKAREAAVERWKPMAQQLFDQSENIGVKASTSASDDAEGIINSTRDARDRLVRLSAGLLLILAISLAILFLLVVQPLIRLSRALELAREGYYLTSQKEVFSELQILSDAAAALAAGNRELDASRQALDQLAHTDALTGLANRRKFTLIAERELARSARYGTALSFVMFDIDHFKKINDSHGHDVGDAVLRALGQTLSQVVRQTDLVARLGGEEFGALLPVCVAEMAALSAERLRSAVAEIAVPLASGEKLRFTASFGVAELGGKDDSLDALMRRADAALYQAKKNGRNRVETAAANPDLATAETVSKA